MSQKQITALIIIFLYMIATIAIGLIVSKMKSKKKASQSNEDFLMAGKSLGPLTLAGTLFAANTGGASTTGIATNVFQYGLSASWYVIAGGIGFILVSFILLILDGRLLPRFLKSLGNVTENRLIW